MQCRMCSSTSSSPTPATMKPSRLRSARRRVSTTPHLWPSRAPTDPLPAELESKELKLVTLVESLGEYLNNEDGKIRAKSETAQGIPSVKCIGS